MAINKKQRILDSAKTIFLKKGYSGSSISEIAKEAGAAKSLVFHHFPNKEALWRAVKETLLSQVNESDFTPIRESTSVQALIDTIVACRYHAYVDNPDLATLLGWQQLESSPEPLLGIDKYQPDDWEEAIVDLQAKGLMTSEYSADIICSMIYGAVSNVFFDKKRKLYNNNQKLEAYKACVTTSLVKALSLK
tara:strand:- start:17540 stop:18115 length:576 start_codon:yes stop_codon:yes gene_type:complete